MRSFGRDASSFEVSASAAVPGAAPAPASPAPDDPRDPPDDAWTTPTYRTTGAVSASSATRFTRLSVGGWCPDAPRLGDPPRADAPVLVRPATLGDAAAIHAIVAHWAARGEHLPRTREEVEHLIGDFVVAESSARIVACASLVAYTPDLAEIRSVGTVPGAEGRGLGTRVVRHCFGEAAARGHGRVFVLTRAPAFFGRLGFVDVPIDDLPEKVQGDCVRCPRRHACDEIAMLRPSRLR